MEISNFPAWAASSHEKKVYKYLFFFLYEEKRQNVIVIYFLAVNSAKRYVDMINFPSTIPVENFRTIQGSCFRWKDIIFIAVLTKTSNCWWPWTNKSIDRFKKYVNWSELHHIQDNNLKIFNRLREIKTIFTTDFGL